MPLLKSKPATDTAPAATQAAPPEEHKAEDSQPTQPAPTRKSTAPMTKDDYWRRREERDVVKDRHIRLSVMLEALLGSVNFGQYCNVPDKGAYLEEVKKAALELATFVTEKA